ncbi:ankyrin repeat domain-containing protein [Bacillus sp. es.036]|uniref:ankyrin repeat domain-containing protein n=1 Tax=Bacillus sp. es.036 TaxID=1761764 RepID=UPI000BF3F267|nr:ankyrin repeat domain-containing protein [Bacillus sp. es.036]
MELVSNLIDYGASPNLLLPDGYTPLTKAVKENNAKLIEILLSSDIDVNFPNKSGNTVLLEALKSDDMELVKTILDLGANLNALDDNSTTTPLIQATTLNSEPFVKLLLESGSNTNQQINNNKTALEIALENNNKSIIELLLKYGAIPENLTSNGNTPLIIAIEQNNNDLTQFMLKYVKDINATNVSGVTPLMKAVDKNNYEISELLLNKGADPNKKDKEGNYPIEIASINNDTEIIDLLQKSGSISLVEMNIDQYIGYWSLEDSIAATFQLTKVNNATLQQSLVEDFKRSENLLNRENNFKGLVIIGEDKIKLGPNYYIRISKDEHESNVSKQKLNQEKLVSDREEEKNNIEAEELTNKRIETMNKLIGFWERTDNLGNNTHDDRYIFIYGNSDTYWRLDFQTEWSGEEHDTYLNEIDFSGEQILCDNITFIFNSDTTITVKYKKKKVGGINYDKNGYVTQHYKRVHKSEVEQKYVDRYPNSQLAY